MDLELAELACRVSLSACRRILDDAGETPLAGMKRREYRLAEMRLDDRIDAYAEAKGSRRLKTHRDDNQQFRGVENRAKQETTIYCYGTIGERGGGFSVRSFIDAVKAVPDGWTLVLRIHSEGGNFTDSLACRAALKEHRGPTVSIIDGIACSAASVLFVSAARRVMRQNSWLMIHQASLQTGGTGADLRRDAELLDMADDELADIYLAEGWNAGREELVEAIARESWFRAESAVAVGLADEISGEAAIAASLSRRFSETHAAIPSALLVEASASRFDRDLAVRGLIFAELELERLARL